jgi:hypothetical protein
LVGTLLASLSFVDISLASYGDGGVRLLLLHRALCDGDIPVFLETDHFVVVSAPRVLQMW